MARKGWRTRRIVIVPEEAVADGRQLGVGEAG